MLETKRLRMAALLMQGLSIDELNELTTLLLEERQEWHTQQLEIFNIPVVSNNEMAVCDALYHKHICLSSMKYRYCPHCGKPLSQTDC